MPLLSLKIFHLKFFYESLPIDLVSDSTNKLYGKLVKVNTMMLHIKLHRHYTVSS